MLRTTRLALTALAALASLIVAVLVTILVSTLFNPGQATDIIRVRYPAVDWALPLKSAQLALLIVITSLLISVFVFVRLLSMVGSLAAGDPFSPANARFLGQIGWALLAVQLCDLAFGIVARQVEVALGDQVTSWTPSVAGWLSVLLAFVLARIFERGALMRDELELTV